MSNCYADLTTIKRRLGITATTWDTDFLVWMNTSSRFIDGYCKRKFYVQSATRYYDGAGDKLFVDDLLSVSTLKVDDNADGTYEDSYTASTDYELWPYDNYPKTMALISSRADRGYTNFGGPCRKAVQIVGSFGYGDGQSATPYTDSGVVTAEDLDATETGIDISSTTPFGVGQTILIGSEQCYISAITAVDGETSAYLTVTRGVNGTTAATHDTGASIYIYQYPETVVEACITQVCQWYKLATQTGYTGLGGSPEFGAQTVIKGLDPNVKLMLGPLVKRVFA